MSGGWLGSNALLGLLAAGLWGVGDYSGGMGVKTAGGGARAGLRLILLSHVCSFSVLLAAVLWRGDPFPHRAPLYWGLGAGVAGALSLCGFYVALSRGAMGASAAVSGILAAAIPAFVSMATDGTPGWKKICGFVVAAIAIWMIAAGAGAREQASTMWLATVAGAGFGVYFVALKYAGSAGLLWPMATARMGSISSCVLLLVGLSFTGQVVVPVTRALAGWVLLTALFDTSGNMMFVAATRAGRLDVAAVLASLYPASTILLAAWQQHERPTSRQIRGMLVAVLAVVLIAA